MKETERIVKLFADMYNGSPWIDSTIMGALENISAEQAVARVIEGRNSIWELTNHMISWRQNVLQRVQGKLMVSPDNNYIEPITDTSEAAWQNTLKEMENSQQEWILFLKTFNEDAFETMYPRNGMTYYEHIHGIIQHDAYHLGQIVMLAKSYRK
ncbi:MAG: DinB family protein [Bacteroidota bacterium]